ncbi:MAG: hypothetical protein F6J97_02660 [Leptolyngbya sp. SIO4C1]|nr:hypothetical protein [Leptolyngbya sp. SIO4C1]
MTTCAYDPNSGQPNPLGMRVYLSLQAVEGNTNVIFEEFPSAVAGQVPTTIASERTLTFYNTSISRARELLLSEPSYYQTLVGSPDAGSFAAVNAVLACQTGDAVAAGRPLPELGATPVRSPNRPLAIAPGQRNTVATLPDGNYRYWSGTTEFRVLSDDELLDLGGVLFLFRKRGNQVVGSYAYIDGEAICVSGQVSGNTISGQAYPADGRVSDPGERFESWGPAGLLQVRRARAAGFYASALLNLDQLSRINAGTALPPAACEPQTDSD